MHYKNSIKLHEERRGKWEMGSKVSLESQEDLSLAYTPGVAGVCTEIEHDSNRAYSLSMKGNTVAIISDGTAVLGLGNIGPQAALPVMEGKAILFKRFADVDGVPIVIDSKSTQHLIETIRAISPGFGGINLEDIAAPACFEVEEALQDIGIPVFHDDQHGTAIVLLAALINAARVTGKSIADMRVVINGAGAAGTAIARLLRCIGHDKGMCTPVAELLICDTKGIISSSRTDLNDEKKKLLSWTNSANISGSLADALFGADVFIGVSKANLLNRDHILSMAPKPIIFAMANPVPEIMPDIAKEAGAAVVGTGRSDFPNQVNNCLAFPGIFRGALDARAKTISDSMKLAAAFALADYLSADELSVDRVLPSALDRGVASVVARAVYDQAKKES
ncbi:MAG: NADP-dependent malic enzyme [bacterium]|nr:NADP-dependent malic enzyme [bacterium]